MEVSGDGLNLWSSNNILWVGLTGVVTWLIKNERRFAKVMTREEHEKICIQRNDALGKVLDDIKAELKASAAKKEALLAAISDMKTDIGILKERTARD